MNFRHINRGDMKEGGCPLCKPRRARAIDCGGDLKGVYEYELEADPQYVPPEFFEWLDRVTAVED